MNGWTSDVEDILRIGGSGHHRSLPGALLASGKLSICWLHLRGAPMRDPIDWPDYHSLSPEQKLGVAFLRRMTKDIEMQVPGIEADVMEWLEDNRIGIGPTHLEQLFELREGVLVAAMRAALNKNRAQGWEGGSPNCSPELDQVDGPASK